MDVKDSKYLKFIEFAEDLCKDVPRYFSRFSNKIFCNHQKIILLVLKQKMRTSYRDLIEILKITHIPEIIGLKRIPHHTTLVKFDKKINCTILNLLLPYRKAKFVGLDGTGFEVENKSMHYQYRTERCTYRRYIKLGISADTEKQLILKNTIHKGPRNDNKDFLLLVKDIQAKEVIADKGYDSRKNRAFVKNALKAIPVIPIRRHTYCYGFLHGRKKIDGKNYHQRSKLETIFSSIKRKYGSCLKARSFLSKKKEVLYKLIAYNVDRLVKMSSLLIKGFQQSPTKKHINSSTGMLFEPTPEGLANAIEKLYSKLSFMSPREYVLKNTGIQISLNKLKNALRELSEKEGQEFNFGDVYWDGRNQSLVWGRKNLYKEIDRALKNKGRDIYK